MFRIGGSLGGFYYGVQGYGGYPDDSGNIGPQVNSYSDFAGVFGTGVYVTGVAGTSVKMLASTARPESLRRGKFRTTSLPAFTARRRACTATASLGGQRTGSASRVGHERQREGVAKAKAEGKYKGRAPTARAKAPEVRQLHKDGVGATEIARRLRISRASVYRVLGP